MERVKGIEPSYRVWLCKMVWFQFSHVLYVVAAKHFMKSCLEHFKSSGEQWFSVAEIGEKW